MSAPGQIQASLDPLRCLRSMSPTFFSRVFSVFLTFFSRFFDIFERFRTFSGDFGRFRTLGAEVKYSDLILDKSDHVHWTKQIQTILVMRTLKRWLQKRCMVFRHVGASTHRCVAASTAAAAAPFLKKATPRGPSRKFRSFLHFRRFRNFAFFRHLLDVFGTFLTDVV